VCPDQKVRNNPVTATAAGSILVERSPCGKCSLLANGVETDPEPVHRSLALVW